MGLPAEVTPSPSSLEPPTEPFNLRMSKVFKYSLHESSNRDEPSSIEPPSAELEFHATPGTDLWRKPPVESFNAPSITTCIKTGSFKSACVTVSAHWTRLYDQGGLVLIWPRAGEVLGSKKPPAAWVKTGIELQDEQANLSTVATPTSDWSLVPLSSNSVTIVIERGQMDSGNEPSLWVYLLDHGQRKAVREITWVFAEGRLNDDLYVGLYAARPTRLPNDENDTEKLAVHFTDFNLEVTGT